MQEYSYLICLQHMRQAIQYANPAPAAGLIRAHAAEREAGERAFEILWSFLRMSATASGSLDAR